MSDRTIRLHRVIRSTPERLYRAFTDADAMAKPAQRQSRHKRGSLSMPYFSFAQSLRPRG